MTQSRRPVSRPLRQGYTRRALVRVAAGTLAATLLAACGERAPKRIASSPAPSPEALPMPTMAVPTPTMAIPAPTATPPPTVAARTRQAIATAVVTSAPDPTPSPTPLPSTPVPTVIARKVPPAGAKAVFFGDSISDPGTFGQYAPLVCQRYGWALTNADPFSPTRAGIRGTILQANDYTLSNGITTFPQRVWAFNPDVVVMFYGVNDYYYVSRSPTPTTPTTWRTAVRTILTGFRALPTRPFVVVVGLPTLTLPLGPRVPSWATSEGDVQRQMDAITWEECGLARDLRSAPPRDADKLRAPGRRPPHANGRTAIHCRADHQSDRDDLKRNTGGIDDRRAHRTGASAIAGPPCAPDRLRCRRCYRAAGRV